MIAPAPDKPNTKSHILLAAIAGTILLIAIAWQWHLFTRNTPTGSPKGFKRVCVDGITIEIPEAWDITPMQGIDSRVYRIHKGEQYIASWEQSPYAQMLRYPDRLSGDYTCIIQPQDSILWDSIKPGYEETATLETMLHVQIDGQNAHITVPKYDRMGTCALSLRAFKTDRGPQAPLSIWASNLPKAEQGQLISAFFTLRFTDKTCLAAS